MGCVAGMNKLDDKTNAHLHSQLVKLGDMMGDGLHLEPGGKWINTEYRKILKSLGMLPPRKNNVANINEAMIKRVAQVPCPNCNGALKQTRSGAKRAKCQQCSNLYKLLK